MKSKGLLILIISMILLYIFTFFYTPEKNSFSICPSKMFLGIRCPLCGLGKAFSYLSKGNILLAIKSNKSVLLFYPIYLFAIYLLLVSYINNNKIYKLPGEGIIAFIKKKSFHILICLTIIAFAIYFFDLLTNSGENFFDYNYTIYSKIIKK